ncbi:MAG TPA: ABC transporter substrate-binding protein [Candidatus Limnocylindria bacterium]|nr:ABC transporter substrate-binding protein [Candidatus Limnocylindria bacterium]
MRKNRTLALGAALLALVVSACAPGGGSSPAASDGSPGESAAASGGTVTIGSQGFYESQLMAEIYAQALEANGYTVERNLGIGTREQTYPALTSGQIDMMPEYIGSLTTFLEGEASGDPAETASVLADLIGAEGLTLLDYTPAQDQNAFVVRSETAEELGLETMSDLAEHATELVWGLPPECETNPLCAGALEDSYGITFADLEIEPLAACDAPIATALNDGVVDVAELCSTQPDIERFGFVRLDDDMQTQPAENIAPIISQEKLDELGNGFADVLNAVSAAMTTEDLTSLGVQVAVEQRDAAEVATEWLTDMGLI